MRTYIITIVFLFMAIALHASAKDDKQEKYIADLATLDITMQVPKGFHTVSQERNYKLPIDNERFKKYDETAHIWAYSLIMESDNNEACILLPVILADNPKICLGHVIQTELQSSHYDYQRDINQDLTVIKGKNLTDYANADTVLLYNIKLETPILDKYSHCMGIALRKYAHQTMLIKIGLSDNALKHKDKYIKKILASLKYGDSETETLVKREKSILTINNGKGDFVFPKPRFGTGIVLECATEILLENEEWF